MYTAKGTLDRDDQLRQYTPLVRRLAHHMIAKLPPSVEVDDLIQVGMIGLTEAISRFEPSQGVQFETFASQRIRGAMIRSPLESEIAQELGLALADYQHLLAKVRGTQLVYLEDISGHGDDEDSFLDRHAGESDSEPSAVLQDQRMRTALVGAIKLLPEREQQIMSMYYEHDMNLKEIAAVLNVTESRICQLHSQSIARLRAKLREH
jgi:RNA polymerase sigma factor for flagellar operon FliA